MGRDIERLTLPLIGTVVETDRKDVPFTITDAAGTEVLPVNEFMRDFVASDSRTSSCRSYAYDLLRWWRWLAAIGVEWDRAQRTDVRDLVLFLRTVGNPQRKRRRPDAPKPGSINSRTGKAYLREGYAPRTINHQLAVLATFYDFHCHAGTGPLQNPVPVGGGQDGSARPNAHGNPMFPMVPHRRAAFRQRVPDQAPRAIPDSLWVEIFAALKSNRDRAILATYISSGARASELLGMRCRDIDFAQQSIWVVSKGSHLREEVPVSTDALVWIRLYLAEGLVSSPDQPLPPDAHLWITLRGEPRPLTYMAMRRVLQRVNESLGTNISLHDLRHTCAMRMVSDPYMSIADVQTVLRHRSLASTQIYTRVKIEELVQRVQEHHERLASAPPPSLDPAYDPWDLQALFGEAG